MFILPYILTIILIRT
jgi:ATP-dependent RNA helicase DDX19/DBP5